MTNVLANLARMSSSTTGTGTLTLDMAAQGCLTFAESGVTNGQIVSYAIEDYDTAGTVINREVGAGTYSTAGPTLGRTTVYASTNSNNRINCSGRQHVFITALKEDFDSLVAAIASATSSASTAVTTATAAAALAGAAFAFGPDNDEPSAIPGPRGQDGPSGSAGPQGPMGPPGSGDGDFDETAIPVPPSIGTAAFAYTGASGHTLPFLDTANTFSAQQIFDISATASPFAATGLVNLSENGAAAGPYWTLRRTSTSPAANDSIGVFNFQGSDSAANVNQIYAQLAAVIVDPTDGAEYGSFSFNTTSAGTTSAAATIGQGMRIGAPTGGDKGAGTLNASTLYEGGIALSEKYGRRDSFGAGFAFSEPGEDGMMGPPGPQGATGAAGGGGGGSATTVEVNLGSAPNAYFQGKFTITDAAISGTSKVLCWQAPGPYTGKGTRADEAEMQPVQVIAVEPAAGSAVVKWQTPPMVVEQPLMAMGGQPASAIVPGGKDPQAIAGGPAKRIGRVRGNVKFSYTVFA